MGRITDTAGLRERHAAPTERTIRKELDHLDRHARSFLAASPFMVLATVGADGRLDASPRGDAPGFVQVADETTLLIPDRPGNNRLDSLTNLLDRPRAATLFMIPGVDETLRCNGTIAIHDDEDLRARFAVAGREPKLVLVMSVDQVYLHCAKAFMRSGLWDPESWPKERPVPTMGEMIHDQIAEAEAAETQEAMLARYEGNLY